MDHEGERGYNSELEGIFTSWSKRCRRHAARHRRKAVRKLCVHKVLLVLIILFSVLSTIQTGGEFAGGSESSTIAMLRRASVLVLSALTMAQNLFNPLKASTAHTEAGNSYMEINDTIMAELAKERHNRVFTAEGFRTIIYNRISNVQNDSPIMDELSEDSSPLSRNGGTDAVVVQL